MTATRVLHLAERDVWEAAPATGAYAGSTRGRTVSEVGFVHLSTAAQLPAVMAYAYADVPAARLVLLVVDLSALAAHGIEVRWENLDGGAEPYPHAYGTVPLDAIVAALPMATDDAGALALPDLHGLGVLEHPPVR